MEIERKFLVTDKFKMHEYIADIKPQKISQFYLNSIEDKYIIRYRAYDDETFMLELKSRGDMSREEIAHKITKKEYLEGISHAITSIKKLRYTILDNNNRYLEIDVYEKYDFCTVEIEFDNKFDAYNYKPEDWFNKDVTIDETYKNINLAK